MSGKLAVRAGVLRRRAAVAALQFSPELTADIEQEHERSEELADRVRARIAALRARRNELAARDLQRANDYVDAVERDQQLDDDLCAELEKLTDIVDDVAGHEETL